MKVLIILIAGVLYWTQILSQVSYERIANAENEPGNWLTYSGNYYATRYSSLSEINKNNVEKLVPIWIYQLKSGMGGFEEVADFNSKVIVETDEANENKVKDMIKEAGGTLDNPNIEIPKRLEDLDI